MSTLRSLICNHLTDKDTTHSYLEPYEDLFAPRRQTANRILEVGVQNGGSVLLWRDYFPNADVFGIDHNPFCHNVRGARIQCIEADAYTDDTVEKLRESVGSFDVLIDDGSHLLPHLKFFAEKYTSLLAPGGVLVIEDVPTMDWVDEIRHAFPVSLRDQVQVLDRRDVKGQYDDIMMVLQLAV